MKGDRWLAGSILKTHGAWLIHVSDPMLDATLCDAASSLSEAKRILRRMAEDFGWLNARRAGRWEASHDGRLWALWLPEEPFEEES